MKKAHELLDIFIPIEKSSVSTQEVAAQVRNRIAEIRAEDGRDEKWQSQQISAVREEGSEKINTELGKIGPAFKILKSQEKHYEDPLTVMDTLPITNSNNETTEILAVNTYLNLISRLPSGRLAKMGTEAIEDRNYGKLRLLVIENGTREGKPGFTPINLEGLQIPEQQAGLEIIKKASKARGYAIRALRDVGGASPEALAKLTLDIERGAELE